MTTTMDRQQERVIECLADGLYRQQIDRSSSILPDSILEAAKIQLEERCVEDANLLLHRAQTLAATRYNQQQQQQSETKPSISTTTTDPSTASTSFSLLLGGGGGGCLPQPWCEQRTETAQRQWCDAIEYVDDLLLDWSQEHVRGFLQSCPNHEWVIALFRKWFHQSRVGCSNHPEYRSLQVDLVQDLLDRTIALHNDSESFRTCLSATLDMFVDWIERSPTGLSQSQQTLGERLWDTLEQGPFQDVMNASHPTWSCQWLMTGSVEEIQQLMQRSSSLDASTTVLDTLYERLVRVSSKEKGDANKNCLVSTWTLYGVLVRVRAPRLMSSYPQLDSVFVHVLCQALLKQQDNRTARMAIDAIAILLASLESFSVSVSQEDRDKLQLLLHPGKQMWMDPETILGVQDLLVRLPPNTVRGEDPVQSFIMELGKRALLEPRQDSYRYSKCVKDLFPKQVDCTNEEPRQTQRETRHIMSVVLATAGYDHSVRFWEAPTGNCTKLIKNLDNPALNKFSQINKIEITPDKQFIGVAGNTTVNIYDIENSDSQNPQLTCEGHTNNVTSLGFQRDGRYLYTGSEDGTVKLWDLKGSQCCRSWNVGAPVNSVTLRGDRDELISGDQDGFVKVWDMNQDTPLYSIRPAIKPHTGTPLDASSYDGATISSHSSVSERLDGAAIAAALRRNKRKLHANFSESMAPIQAVDISEDSRTLVAVTNRGTVFVWDPSVDMMNPQLQQQQQQQQLGDSVDHTSVWPYREIRQFRAHTEVPGTYVLQARIAPDCRHLVTTGSDGSAKLWDTTTWDLHRSLAHGRNFWVWDAAFCADCSYLVTACSDAKVRLWNLQYGTVTKTYTGHDRGVTCVALNDSSA